MTKRKNIIFSILVTSFFFASTEGVSRFFVFPGSYDYIERCAIQQNLPQHKNRDEFRIQLYGESTMHGSSLYPYSTIDKWMKLYISDLLPEKVARRVTVTNFGRLAAESGFIANAFLETSPYRPDLAVFYIAHNDFAQVDNRRAFFSKKTMKEQMEDFTESLPKISSFLNAINRLIISGKIVRNREMERKEKKLDHWYNEEDEKPPISAKDLLYPDSPQWKALQENFHGNVDKIVAAARKRSIPVLFLEGVAKWKGYEPVRSMHSPAVTGNALTEWEKMRGGAEGLSGQGRYADALALFEKCLEIDPAYAMTYYKMGECYERLGDSEKANQWYALANDKDCFPIRGPSAVNAYYEKLRDQDMDGVYVVDTPKIFEKESFGGIIDDTVISNQIHPTIKGQALIALEIVRVIYEKNLLAKKEEWRWERLRSPGETEKSLNLSKDDKFEIALASAGYVRQHYGKAVKFLEKAMELKPDSVYARSWLAWTYLKNDEPEKAWRLYGQLYKETPDRASPFFNKYPQIRREVLRGTVDIAVVR